MVTGASGWEYTTPDHERTCKVYVKTELQNAGPAPRCVLSFTVLFDPATGALANASATDDNEQEWGKMAQGLSTYTKSGDQVESFIGCPDGAEICSSCFEAGAH